MRHDVTRVRPKCLCSPLQTVSGFAMTKFRDDSEPAGNTLLTACHLACYIIVASTPRFVVSENCGPISKNSTSKRVQL